MTVRISSSASSTQQQHEVSRKRMLEQDAGREEKEWHDHDEHESSQSMASNVKTEMIRHVLCLSFKKQAHTCRPHSIAIFHNQTSSPRYKQPAANRMSHSMSLRCWCEIMQISCLVPNPFLLLPCKVCKKPWYRASMISIKAHCHCVVACHNTTYEEIWTDFTSSVELSHSRCACEIWSSCCTRHDLVAEA